MVTFTINIPQMLAYIPYMDPEDLIDDTIFLICACSILMAAIFQALSLNQPKSHKAELLDRHLSVVGIDYEADSLRPNGQTLEFHYP